MTNPTSEQARQLQQSLREHCPVCNEFMILWGKRLDIMGQDGSEVIQFYKSCLSCGYREGCGYSDSQRDA